MLSPFPLLNEVGSALALLLRLTDRGHQGRGAA